MPTRRPLPCVSGNTGRDASTTRRQLFTPARRGATSSKSITLPRDGGRHALVMVWSGVSERKDPPHRHDTVPFVDIERPLDVHQGPYLGRVPNERVESLDAASTSAMHRPPGGTHTVASRSNASAPGRM